MSNTQSVARVCPRCGRPSGPSQDAGEAVCSCGAAAPDARGEGAADAYELAPEPAGASTRATLPVSTGGREPRALSYRAPKDEAPGRAEPETIRDLYLPLWLLGGGVLVEVIAAVIRERQFAAALIHVGVELSVGTTLMLAGILLAAWLRNIDLGRSWVAVFKLAAISVAPAAAVSLVTPLLNFIPLGGLIGWAGAFVFYFALLGALFDLDQSDTWYCVCVIFLVRLAVYFLLLGIGVR